MPPVTANSGELYQVLIQGTIENQQCENVLWFRAQSADTDVALHLITVVLQCFVTNLLPVLASTYVFERVVGRRMVPDEGPEVEVLPDAGDATAGQAAGDAEPSFVSALISLHSLRGGKSGRGRMYIAGVPEGSTTASRITVESPLWAGLIAFAACMVGAFSPVDNPGSGHWNWGVFSRKLGGSKQPFNATGFAAILNAVPKQELATTRSRKLGHGK